MSDNDQATLYLLDGMALAYRGYFAMLKNPPMTASGVNTSAPFVFTSTLLEILEKRDPTHIAVVFDVSGPTHRHEEYPEYKAQREAMPEDLRQAMPSIFRICDGFQIPVIREPGWEADDVIGTLSKRAEAAGASTYMVTPDKDFAQLVSQRTFIYKPGRSGSGPEVLGDVEVREKWQIESVDQVRDILGLMGDAVDNVPGVPGIGQKTATKLVKEFGSVENLLDRLSEIKGKRRIALEENRDQALLSKKLVTIVRDVPVEGSLEDFKRKSVDKAVLKDIFVELEFNALGKRIFGDEFHASPKRIHSDVDVAGSLFGEQEVQNLKTLTDVEHDYRIVEGIEEREKLISHLLNSPFVSFDLETTGLDTKSCDIIGIAFSTKPNTGFFVPFPESRKDATQVLEEFRPVLENEEIVKIGHNLKFDVLVLLWHGMEVAGKLFDTMVAAFLAVPEMRRGLDYLAQALIGYKPIPIVDLIGEKGNEQRKMREVPLDELVEYAVEDADVTLQLSTVLEDLLKEKNQTVLYEKVEAPLIRVLAHMEISGIKLDVNCLRQLSDQMAGQIDASARRVEELAGEPFNLSSPSQLGNILFDKLKLDPNARRTQKSKQYKTDEQVLTRLSHEHEIAREILNFRLCSKLKSTYLDMLPESVFEKTGRIHTYYEQAVAATGRVQSSGPNLQNIPIRTEQGREIRKAFIPNDGDYTLLSADYSQIELRVIAEISKDDRMNRAFEVGEDIHTVTASRIYGVSPETVTDDMRRQSKTVNFGIIYGISAFGLSERLGLPRQLASDMIEQYFEEYPGVRSYMDDTVEFAREHGFVETILGRRRYLKDINSRSVAARKAAERNAINSPVQGTAADMIKLAMTNIHQMQIERGWQTKMLLQVHDELVFDLFLEEQEEVMSAVEEAMKTAIPMKVPIVVEMGTGDTWLEAH